MDRRNLIILGVAILLGGLAVFLANSWFSGVEERQEKIAEQQKLVRVAVAVQDLPFGTPLSADNVRLVNWPAESLPDGAITDLPRLMAGKNVAIRPIARGEPILISRISDRAILSANIPENMRAVTIPVNAVSGVAGFVFPGDVVDIFLTRKIPGDGAGSDDKMTTVVLENVQVLAVDRRASETNTEPELAKTVTVLVDQRGAQKLALGEQVGRLTMALRNVEDQLMGAEPVITTRDLGGRGIYMVDRSRRAPAGSSGPVPVIRADPDLTPRDVVTTPPPPRGPTMTVVRGTDSSTQEVRRHGSY